MSPLPGREALEAMKRVDIQRLCKDYGVKANLKTEALIDLLVDASQPPPPRTSVQPQPVSNTSMRRSSRTSIRSRGMSGSSVIIHDTDEEEENFQAEDHPTPSQPEPKLVPSAPRTRKGKETQSRLGVGRPVAAGGNGARAVTKSGSVSRGSKRGKGSRSIKPVEDTIIEEEPEPSDEETHIIPDELPHAGASGTDHELALVHQLIDTQPPAFPDGPLESLQIIDRHVAEALRPIHAQMHSLKSELERLRTQVAEAAVLQAQVQSLQTEIVELREHVQNTKQIDRDAQQRPQGRSFQSPTEASSSGIPLAPKVTGLTGDVNASRSNSFGAHTVDRTSSHNAVDMHPASIMLGKRHRDSTDSNVTGVFEAGHEDQFSEAELEKKVSRPTKKRAKIDQEGNDILSREGSHPRLDVEPEALTAVPRVSSFAVFSGPSSPPPRHSTPSYDDPPPPTTHLPDFFGPPSPPSIPHSRPATSTAHAAENQNPFNFAFLSSTPAAANPLYPTTMPSFPYPEPPQSPSPAGANRHYDASHMFGVDRPLSRASGDAFVNPAALLRASSVEAGRERGRGERNVTSNEVAAGLGLTAVRTAEPESSVGAGPMRKTMYGTELDGDTRFGDFGVEGVATGFWAGGR